MDTLKTNYRSIPIHLKTFIFTLKKKKSITSLSERLAELKHTKSVQCTTATASKTTQSNFAVLHKVSNYVYSLADLAKCF